MIRPPRFWWLPEPTLAAWLLSPLGWFYGQATASRMARQGARAPCPVICVGNFTTGGSGKTPVALHLAALLAERGERPVFLTRGYGGTERGPIVVDPARHGAAAVGDEPLLLARRAPTIVSADRAAGAGLAASLGASAIIMDDGLQNPGLARDLSFAVIDGGVGFGNGLVFPAGPLRAPVAAQRGHVAAAIIIGEGEAGHRAASALGDLPVINASLAPAPAVAAMLAGKRVIAMAGIGLPDKFVATLTACGADIVGRHFVPDHAPYQAPELLALAARAEAQDALVVTTEKDAARIGPDMPPALASRLAVLPVALRIDRGAERLAALLDRALARR